MKNQKRTHSTRPQQGLPGIVVNPNQIEATLDAINRLDIWKGLIRWSAWNRIGPMVVAMTDENVEVIWTNMADFYSFTKSQWIIGGATNITIPTPPQGEIRTQWEWVVRLALRFASKDKILLRHPLKEKIQDDLMLAWEAAGRPSAKDNGQFIDFMREVKTTRRNPALVRIPPVVFIAEECAWVHVPSFRLWLGIPSLRQHSPELEEVRNGLLLLEFRYCENCHRGYDGDEEASCLWRGPVEALEG